MAFPGGFLVDTGGIALMKLFREIGPLPDGRIDAAQVSRGSFEG
ncbi:MAG: hypothetical protein NWR21_03765 [Verrucomicrobiales bacterium]|nr:hypothetical protein [Verrucomicrobiales bacterium]MDP4793462.1 hypothetical protein [Verrucomicrobiales bacterium]MDP4938410.1 hypothetical protein [Verrucomicrobiales bacterium]